MIIRLFALLFPAVLAVSAQDDFTSIALLGCHQQGRPAPAIPYIAETIRPDYCIWLGDNVYADTRKDAEHIRRQLEILAAKPGFSELKSTSKFHVTWDDHDYGLNNAGAEYEFREASKQIHREFWELEDEIPADRDGVYYSVIETLPNGKRLQVILLDGRYNKVKRGRDADALGENQWRWLEGQLRHEADLRLVVSGYQVLLNRPTRWEAWIKLGHARKRLFNLVKDTGAAGVLFLTGDQHTAEILRTKKALGYDAYEIMACGINQTERPGRAHNRILGPDKTLHSAPFLTIYWEVKDGRPPHIHFRNIDVETGTTSSEYILPLSELGL
jgi:alkaline phosphatase D